MSLFSSLTNRIFFGSALLAVGSIAIAIYNVNVAVTRQAEEELRRGLDEAGTIIEEYRRVLVDHFTREARLIADLPRLKASVDTNDPTTVQPIAEEYQRQLTADLLLVTGRQGQTLAEVTSAERLDRFVCVAARRQGRVDRPGVELVLAASRRHPAGRHRAHLDRSCSSPRSSARSASASASTAAAASRFQASDQQRHRVRDERHDSRLDARAGAVARAGVPCSEARTAAAKRARRRRGLHRQDAGAVDRPVYRRTGESVPATGTAEAAGASVIILRSRTQRLGFSTRSTAGWASSRSSPCSRPRF